MCRLVTVKTDETAYVQTGDSLAWLNRYSEKEIMCVFAYNCKIIFAKSS